MTLGIYCKFTFEILHLISTMNYVLSKDRNGPEPSHAEGFEED